MKTETVILSATVDRLATLKAEIARLKTEEDALKDVLIEGTQHRAAISHCAGRELIDWKTIAAKFNPSRQLIAAHTSQGEPYATVRLSARKA